MVTCKQYKQLIVNIVLLFYCMLHVLSCVGIVAAVWLILTVPFSTVVVECALAPLIPLPPVHPPMTKMDSWLMETTATLYLAVEREATLYQDFFVMSRMATSDVGTPWILPPMITGGYECGNNAVL